MSSVLDNINRYLNRLIPVLAPLGVVLGLFFPHIFINLRPFVVLLFSIITFSGALRLTANELKDSVQSPLPILLFFISSHILMPLIAMSTSSLIFADTDIITGFVLLFAGPTAVSGFIWITINKGDKALGLTLILLNTLLAPLIVPATLLILIGEKIAIDMIGIAISLLFMVVIPTIMGVTLNEISRGKIPQVLCPALDPLAKICLFLVIAANSSVVAPNIRFDDPLVWRTAVLCLSLTIIGFLVAKLNGIVGKFNKEKCISLIFAGGLRNFSVILTIAVTFFPEAVALPTLICIIFQQILAAIMGKVIIRR